MKIQKSKFQYMVWTSFHRSVEFEKLVKELAEVLDYPVKRKALPHVNLARSKNKIPYDLFPILLEKEISFQVRYMELWESHLSPKGATYSVLNSFLFKELGV